MSRQLTRVSEPPGFDDRAPWKHFGRQPVEGVDYPIVRDGFGVYVPQLDQIVSARFRDESWSDGMSFIRATLFACPDGFGWIGDADGRLEFYQHRDIDRDDAAPPLPDCKGRVLPMAGRLRGIEKVA